MALGDDSTLTFPATEALDQARIAELAAKKKAEKNRKKRERVKSNAAAKRAGELDADAVTETLVGLDLHQ